MRRHLLSKSTVLAPITGTRHRILLWTLAGATYLVKIPPGKERPGTLLPETAIPNNLRLITTEAKGKRKKGRFRCAVKDAMSTRISSR